MSNKLTKAVRLDRLLEYSPDEPILVTLLRRLESGAATEDELLSRFDLGAKDALEAIAYLEANGIDCSEVLYESRRQSRLH